MTTTAMATTGTWQPASHASTYKCGKLLKASVSLINKYVLNSMLHASQTTVGMSDLATAKSELLAKMSSMGHQAFIRYASAGYGCTTAVTYTQEYKKTEPSKTAPFLFAGKL